MIKGRLTKEQRDDAKAAYALLTAVPGATLLEVVHSFVVARTGSKSSKSFASGKRHTLSQLRLSFLSSKDHLRVRSYEDLQQKTGAFLNTFHCPEEGGFIDAIEPEDVLRWMDCFAGSGRTYNHYRRVLSSMFKHGLKLGWIKANPFGVVDARPVDQTDITTLSVDEAEELMASAKATGNSPLQTYVALLLYAGIRPGELGVHSGDDTPPSRGVTWDDTYVTIKAASSKTRKHRLIKITRALRDNLVWGNGTLRGCEVPMKAWKQLRKQFPKLTETRDVLRHTYGSMLMGLTHDENYVAEQMGNSPDVIHKHYRVPVSEVDARRFFGEEEV